VIENTLGVLHNTSNKSEHTPRGIINFRSYDVTSCDVTSNPVAILLPVMRNDTFYTNTIVRKKRGENYVTSGHVTSVHVTSISHTTSGHSQFYISYYCDGNALPDMCRTYFRLWRHYRSRDFMWRHFRLGPLPVTSLPVTHTQWHAPLCSPRNIPWAVPIHYFDILIWGDPIDNPWNNIEGRHSSFPLGV
jgi:hypothetical protein